MGRFLCWLGLHKYGIIVSSKGGQWSQCKRCGEK